MCQACYVPSWLCAELVICRVCYVPSCLTILFYSIQIKYWLLAYIGSSERRKESLSTVKMATQGWQKMIICRIPMFNLRPLKTFAYKCLYFKSIILSWIRKKFKIIEWFCLSCCGLLSFFLSAAALSLLHNSQANCRKKKKKKNKPTTNKTQTQNIEFSYIPFSSLETHLRSPEQSVFNLLLPE